jgi:hypothetical protein
MDTVGIGPCGAARAAASPWAWVTVGVIGRLGFQDYDNNLKSRLLSPAPLSEFTHSTSNHLSLIPVGSIATCPSSRSLKVTYHMTRHHVDIVM